MITPAARAALTQEDLLMALNGHLRGGLGKVGPQEKPENNLSIWQGFRLLSAYETAKGQPFWIITEADRTATTVLLPADY